MSTVIPSTSNIERSPHFVSKNGANKNQTSNPIANTFAALLMSAEAGEPSAPLDASDPLADKGRKSPTLDKKDDTSSPEDTGHAALAGLLNWQAMTATDNGAQSTAGSATPSAGTTTNPRINLPVDTLTGKASGSGTSAVAPDITQTLSQASLSAPISLQSEQATSAATGSVPGIDLSDPAPTMASAAAVPASPDAWAASQATMETLANGTDRTGFAKTRMGASRSQLSNGAATTKAAAGTSLQNNTQNGKTTETDLLPRATVDLVARAAQEVASDAAELNTSTNESARIKPESPRLATETGVSGTEHIQAGDHTPTASLPTDPMPLAGVDQNEMADIMDNLSGQIAYWAAQGSQRASLTVGDDKDNQLEVNISMRDGEVHVAFEAAQAEVRDALTMSAEDLLKNMLESKGMTLGEVTVGPRQSSAGSGGEAAPENHQESDLTGTAGTVSSGQRSTSAGTTTLLAPSHRHPAIATATKLDLFA